MSGIMHIGDLHAVGWGEGPGALVTPVKSFVLGLYKNNVMLK